MTKYLESLGDAKDCADTEIDDIVYDLEVGGMLRIMWAAPIFSIMGFNKSPLHLGWAFLHYSKAAYNIFEQCKTDTSLKKKVIEQGIAKIFTDRLLELGIKPIQMTPQQYEKHWDLFGKLGPSFSGPFLPDDPEPEGEDKEKVEPKPNEGISSLQQATLKFYESTGADLKALFDKFDLNNSGDIDFNELLGAAAMCGVGYANLEDAKKAFEILDSDGDGAIDFDEFKAFLKKKRRKTVRAA